MTELVAHKSQVAFATETDRHQSDHLVQGHAAVNDWVQGLERGHLPVHLFVHQPEGYGLVTDEGLIMTLAISNGLFL